MVFLSEAEKTIVQLAETLRENGRDIGHVKGIVFRHEGNLVVNNATAVVTELDELPMPAWDLLPNEKYWEIGRPHGGGFPSGRQVRYAEMMTSRGCPFACLYCHISKETEGSVSGAISKYRMKSHERVIREIDALKQLRAEYVFLEDDSLLAKKPRVLKIFRALVEKGMKLSDINGVNIAHLYRNAGDGRLEPDAELLEAMAEAGFDALTLPFESGCQRILTKYASNKWNVDKMDTTRLIRTAQSVQIRVAGNYTIGYPDETIEEMTETIMMARRHMDEGLAAANIFCIVPFPGSLLFDIAIRDRHLDPDFDTDQMKWFKPIMKNTTVSTEAVQCIRDLAWKVLNKPSYVADKMNLTVEPPCDV